MFNCYSYWSRTISHLVTFGPQQNHIDEAKFIRYAAQSYGFFDV